MNSPAGQTLDWKVLLLIFWSTAFSVGSQILLKYGMSEFAGRGGLELALQAARSPSVLTGLLVFALGAASWLVVLSRIDLAVAYPLGALNYVLVTITAGILLGETVSPTRWAGVALILGGILVIAFSERRVHGAGPTAGHHGEASRGR